MSFALREAVSHGKNGRDADEANLRNVMQSVGTIERESRCLAGDGRDRDGVR